MEKPCFIEIHPDSKENIRKMYNLDDPGRREETIKLFQEWIDKQDHFVKKDFSEDFLEKLIILNKGLLERAKLKLDKLCTFRTLLPEYFGSYNLKEDFKDIDLLVDAVMPKVTTEYYRIYLLKNKGCIAPTYVNYYRRIIIYLTHLLKYDYSVGLIIILDYTDVNMLELAKSMSMTELRQMFTLFVEGYGLRVKGIHFVTPSKWVDGFVMMWKQIMSEKMGNRIQVHKTLESLYKYVPKDLLPIDYGGKEKSLIELHKSLVEVFSDKEHIAYIEKDNEAKTDESRRAPEQFNEQHLGMPGSFRSLVVD